MTYTVNFFKFYICKFFEYVFYDFFTVLGPAENIKVTTPTDYFAFKSFVDERDMRMLWEGRK